MEELRNRLTLASRGLSKKQFVADFVGRWGPSGNRLSRQAFASSLSSIGVNKDLAASLFDTVDTNGDGYVDAAELYAVVSGQVLQETVRPPSSAGIGAYPGANQDAPPSRRSSRASAPPMQPPMQPQRRSNASAPRGPTMPSDPPVQVDFSDIVVDQFRRLILKRGGAHGINTLGRTFRIMDTNRNQSISTTEMEIGLGRFGLHMAPKDLEILMKAIDRQGGGKAVSFDEFMVAVRGPMNRRRLDLIKMAFDVLDRDRSGIVDMRDLAGAYDVSHHPDVLAGTMDTSSALGHFLEQFDCIEQDGAVTLKEFEEYYKNVSASIDNDDYFELMIRNAWHISGGSGWCENTANRRILVTFSDGSQKVVGIQHDLGLDFKNHAAVLKALDQQGVKNVRTFKLYA